MSQEWESLGPAKFVPDGGSEVRFPVRKQEMSDGVRLMRHERAFRDGAKLDSTGAKPGEIVLECPFFNSIEEPDLLAASAEHLGAEPLWPDRLEQLLAALRLGKVGTLNLPWRQNIRCRGENWKRTGDAGERDGEVLVVTFWEDNEDAIDAASSQAVSVATNMLKNALDTVFDMESSGMWDGSFEQFTELASDLEGALNAPGEFLSDVRAKARRFGRACQSVRDSFTKRVTGRSQLLGPEGARIEQRLAEMQDLAARALAALEAQLPPILTRTFATDRDIFQIATELGQNARDLISINGDLDDVSFIEAGTPVRIFAGAK